jgi:hypothetical protein
MLNNIVIPRVIWKLQWLLSLSFVSFLQDRCISMHNLWIISTPKNYEVEQKKPVGTFARSTARPPARPPRASALRRRLHDSESSAPHAHSPLRRRQSAHPRLTSKHTHSVPLSTPPPPAARPSSSLLPCPPPHPPPPPHGLSSPVLPNVFNPKPNLPTPSAAPPSVVHCSCPPRCPTPCYATWGLSSPPRDRHHAALSPTTSGVLSTSLQPYLSPSLSSPPMLPLLDRRRRLRGGQGPIPQSPGRRRGSGPTVVLRSPLMRSSHFGYEQFLFSLGECLISSYHCVA